MAELYLVRHGQASFGSDNYDQLSVLGHQQSQWLGEYFRDRGISFDRCVVGSLTRQQETVAGICAGLGTKLELHVHAGFNEFDFHALSRAYCAQHPDQAPQSWRNPREVYALLRLAMRAWSNDELTGDLPETWRGFHDRVASAMEIAREQPFRRILAVSSGGAISMALKQVMEFANETVINLNLQSRNTGINHFFFNNRITYVTSFNHVPHLDQPGRLDAITSH